MSWAPSGLPHGFRLLWHWVVRGDVDRGLRPRILQYKKKNNITQEPSPGGAGLVAPFGSGLALLLPGLRHLMKVPALHAQSTDIGRGPTWAGRLGVGSLTSLNSLVHKWGDHLVPPPPGIQYLFPLVYVLWFILWLLSYD
jgi:hypothetical protein